MVVTNIMMRKKLTKMELFRLATLLRGRREEIAVRAGVSIWTVNNTFQDRFQNEQVISAANALMKEALKEENPDVDELREMLKAVG